MVMKQVSEITEYYCISTKITGGSFFKAQVLPAIRVAHHLQSYLYSSGACGNAICMMAVAALLHSR